MRAFDRDLIRGGHYGQRSCEPHLQAEHMAALTQACVRDESTCQPGAVHTCEPHLQADHMAALTQACVRDESTCQPGAVHTWHFSDALNPPPKVGYEGSSGRGLDILKSSQMTLI